MTITHEVTEKGGNFYAKEEEVQMGRLHYNRHDGVLTVTSTFVEDEFKGKGIARQLVNAVVALARENNQKIKPLCSYVDVVMHRDKTLHDLIYED